MNFYGFAWIACVCYAAETLIGKVITKRAISNPWLFNFIFTAFVALITIPIALWNGAGWPAHWSMVVLGSICYAAAFTCFIQALNYLDVSVLTPMYNIRAALAVLLGAVFLGELLLPYQYGLIAAILVFGVVVTLDERLSVKSFFTKGIAFALADMLALALWGLFVKKSVAQIGYWDTNLWIVILGQIWLLITTPLFWKDVPKVKAAQYGGALVVAVAAAAGDLAANKAYAQNVSISATIISVPLSLIIAIAASFFAPKLLEKHTLKVYAIRLAAAAVMLLAALKLG